MHYDILFILKAIFVEVRTMDKVNNNQYDNEFSIDFENISNLSFSAPVYVEFNCMPEKEFCNNWTSVYVYVVKVLFSRHREKLLSLKRTNITNGKRIDFGSKLQYDLMVAPKEIAPSFFVETNFNSKDIIKKIKALLDICEEKYSNLTIKYILKTKSQPQFPKEYEGKKIIKSTVIFNKRAKTPDEKLKKRIFREFDKVKYIGDILINDDEYKILINYLKLKLSSIRTLNTNSDDPFYAVALVQVGIREYDGRYWPHLSRITGIKIDSNQQRLVGERFYNTLIAHTKSHLDKGEIVNNILMHCFIAKQYAPDFFEFIFAYYQHDLDRDLGRHTSEMSNYLIECMKKVEASPRSFRIKKGTADATTANEKGCKIRIHHILKWIDKYLFEDILPESSPNRIANYFCEWAKTSKRFSNEKNAYLLKGEKAKKRFRKPYLKFNFEEEKFYIVLPIQTIRLSNEEQIAQLSWKIRYGNTIKSIQSETEESVIGCRNLETQFVSMDPNDIFSHVRIELIKNNSDPVIKFNIPKDTVRFFDEDFDFLNDKSLSVGKLYAFTKRNEFLESDAYYEKESYLGLDLYSFQQFEKGNVIRKPDGTAISIGNKFEEGLNYNYFINGANVIDNNNSYLLFNKAPSILVKMKDSEQSGTLLIINNKKFRLNANECIVFNNDSKSNSYFLISLENYCKEDGIYNVLVDVPSNRSNKEYAFALIKSFEYKFINAPYVFKSKGSIEFNNSVKISPINNAANTYDFEITCETDKLDFSVNDFNLSIDVPIFKWKLNSEDKWSIKRPEEIWHKELPDRFYFKLPSKQAELFSNQENMDEENEEVIKFDQELNCFVCDTRKVRSWLDLGPALHKLYIRFDDSEFEFLSVVTSCILASCELKNDIANKKLILESTILGFSDCAVDIFNNDVLVAEKLELTSNGTELVTDKLFGKFDLVFYEYDDEEDDLFGFEEPSYSDFAKKSFELKNNYSLLGKTVFIDYITESKKEKSIFSASKYIITDKISVFIETQDDECANIFYGVSKCITDSSLNNLKMQIDLIDLNDLSKALVSFYDDEEECYVEFLYNMHKKTLEKSELTGSKYLLTAYDNYYHISIKNKEK